jgi:O-antigen ligase
MIMGLTLLIYNSVNNYKQTNLIFLSYLLVALFLSVGVIYNYTVGDPWTANRYSVLNENPNLVGFYLALGVGIAIQRVPERTKNIGRISVYITYTYLIVSVFAIVLSGSRTTIVAIIPAVLYLIYYHPIPELVIKNKYIFSTLSLFIIVITANSVFQSTIIQRIASIYGEILTLSFGSRYDIWARGYQVFLESPIYGVGYGGFRTEIIPLVGREVPPENSFLGVLYQLGVVGGLLFITLIYTMVDIGRSEKTVLIFLIISAILMSMNDWLHYPILWILITTVLIESEIKP